METRSRKRAEASSSSAPAPQSPATRASKRARTALRISVPAAGSAAPSGGGGAAAAAPVAMESTESLGRRRSSAKNPQTERDKGSSGKGKEKEAEGSREREEDAERILGLNMDSGGGEEDDDSEDGGGMLHHSLSFSASSALQGLLRKLGAGLDDLLPSSTISGSSHQSGRLKKILSGLRADDEEGRQVEALTQLCNMLSIGPRESLGCFCVDSFVPVLVGLLNHENNPDVMLLAARALTYLCDILPSSCSAVVHYGAVSSFCARLLTIEYMDLAEQSLQALKKISQEHPTACLRAGALMAVLSYLDFFPTGVQRVALSTAANMCKKLPPDAADFVMEAVPLLMNLLLYHDSKVLEHASVCLTRIAEAFSSSPEKLDELCNHGLVTKAASLISVSNSGGLMRLLSTCASGSPLGAKTLLLLGISGILKDILSRSDCNLADELLPLLPHGTISLPVSFDVFVKGSSLKRFSASSYLNQDDSSSIANEVSAREKLLRDQPELLLQFGLDLLPVLIQIHGSSVNYPVRRKCLSVIGKLMYFSTTDMIQSLLGVTNISSFLAGVLAWKDPQVLIPTLQIVEILMEKLPETFSKMFVREGVVHAVDKLILPDASNPASAQAAADPSSRTSSRSRRYRRRNGCKNTDGSGSAGLAKCRGSPLVDVEVPNGNSSFRAAVSARAKTFRDKYFPADSVVTEAWETDDLHHLRNLCMKLNAMVEDSRPKNKGKSKASGLCSFDVSGNAEGRLNAVISEMLRELGKEDGVSTFEFIRSGVVTALLNYFSCGTFPKEKVSEASLPKLRQQVLRKFKSFISISLPTSVDPGSNDAPAPMTILVQKLQSALSSLESFPVILSHSGRSGGGCGQYSGLSALSQPCKLRLCRAEGEKSLSDYSSNVIVVDPLENLAGVEEFLWPRIQRAEPGQKQSSSAGVIMPGSASSEPGVSSISTSAPLGRRYSSGSGRKDSNGKKTSSSSKGKGKAILGSALDDVRGPQTRSAARRRAVSEAEEPVKPSPAKSVSEDEFDVPSVEIDDHLVFDDEDIMSEDEDEEMLRDNFIYIYSPNEVQDVKLIDDVEDGSTSPPVVDGQTQPSPGSSKRMTSGRGFETPEYSLSSKAWLPWPDSAPAAAEAPWPMAQRKPAVGRRLHYNLSEGGPCLRRSPERFLCCRWQFSVSAAAGVSPRQHAAGGASMRSGEVQCHLRRLGLAACVGGAQPAGSPPGAQAAAEDFAEGKIAEFSICAGGTRVPPEEFINNKLAPKLSRQTQEAVALLSGVLPPWCRQLTVACPFLFPFEVRRQYFYSTALGPARALRRLQQQRSADGHSSAGERDLVAVDRLQRQKVRVSRARILESAAKVLGMYSGQKTVLDVEFLGEVGTGLGPTLEYYTLLSREFHSVELGMWRHSSFSGRSSSMQIHGDSTEEEKKPGSEPAVDLVGTPLGLFPRPWPPSADESSDPAGVIPKVAEFFRREALGPPLSTAFYKLVLGQELDAHDILSFDPEFGMILLEMQALVRRKQWAEAGRRAAIAAAADLRFRGTPIEDLCLDFTLPGYPRYALGRDRDECLEEYVDMVVEATVGNGIRRQMEAFRDGFNLVFHISSLRIFSPEELDYLICGRRELWQAETLAEHIKFDHGFTAKSPAIINLLEIMGEFTPEQQRAFCQFVTGAPRLPPGGLAALSPKLTVVRKHSSTGAADATAAADAAADDVLPSVMTCANYLKLPAYSTKEIMYKKLIYAISEGQGSFDLS
ncbi:unnamed protein product [Spirodela intermedia]|uniref:HECT-type E3 ubiquitin transferase n=1 Tax=Spirodela intermedia TaxID=51605 RepID=A0A7I8JTL3_SPIIN|nr:unnamed protein product [Spirodela intermedia]CAA6673508.1 unnamed protein product [Spirodela intermedia]